MPHFRFVLPRLAPVVLLTVGVLLEACGPSNRAASASVQTTSAAMPILQARMDFLHRYVTFRRTYRTLDFDIAYLDGNSGRASGGGGVPGPTEWDIRLVATVPPAELAAWIPPGVKSSSTLADASWLKSIPTSQDLSGINQWYIDGRRIIGIDPQRNLVAYRNWAN